MRLSKGLLAGLVVVGVAGCSGPALSPSASPSSAGQTSTGQASTGQATTGQATTGAPVSGASREPETSAGARAAAAHFYHLYLASEFAASWDLLAPAVKRQVPRTVWIRVHDGCPSASSGTAPIVKSVTIFGNAAIVSESLAVASGRTAEDVFTYANDAWGYSPQVQSIYHRGSVAADIAAAKAAGFCAGWKGF